MTKEQEEAIEIIDKMRKSYIEADECGLSNNDFKYEIRAMQTVLSMLKEKDTELEKKDKINKLLIDFIYRMSIKRPGTIMYDLKEDGFDTSQCGNCKDKSCKECIKQYFERKVKHEN